MSQTRTKTLKRKNTETRKYNKRMEELNKIYEEVDDFELTTETRNEAAIEYFKRRRLFHKKLAEKIDKESTLDAYIDDKNNFINELHADDVYNASKRNEKLLLTMPSSMHTAKIDEKSTQEDVSILTDCIKTANFEGNINPDVVASTSRVVNKANLREGFQPEAASKLPSSISTVGIFSDTLPATIKALPPTVKKLELHRDLDKNQVENLPKSITEATIVSPNVKLPVRRECRNQNITLFRPENELSSGAPEYLQKRFGREQKKDEKKVVARHQNTPFKK